MKLKFRLLLPLLSAMKSNVLLMGQKDAGVGNRIVTCP